MYIYMYIYILALINLAPHVNIHLYQVSNSPHILAFLRLL